jgi:hypothetical protein
MNSIRKQLLAVGLDLAIEKDPTGGHEFSVTTTDGRGQQIAWGWSAGTKTEAAQEAYAHPAVQLRLNKVTA